MRPETNRQRQHSYSACGLDFAATVPFPELCRAYGNGPTFILRVVRRLPAVPEFAETGRTLFPDGQLWLRRSRAGSLHLLEFEGFATFLLDTSRDEILACPHDGTNPAAVRHLFLNQVLPLYLSTRERLALHASAIAVAGCAVAFMGDAGLGKSTLARAFVARGCALVTDDTLMLDRSADLTVVPSYPGLRLWPDSAAALGCDGFTLIKGGNVLKHRQQSQAPSLPAAPVPLSHIYLLSGPAPSISIRPAAARQAITALLRANFLLEVDDPKRLAWQFRRLSDLAARPIFHSLSYPRDFELLPRVCDTVLEHLSQVTS
jgi:hypothetical protein